MSAPFPLHPDDEANRRLVAEVAPADHEAPQPADRYTLVVIGGGPAGLVAAFGAAGLGARVALVERHLLGGDCLVVGCVPSKALLASAKAVHAVRQAHRFGVRVGDPTVDFGAVMRRMRELRADIAPHDGVARLTEAGIDVFLGEARFVGRDEVEVGGQTLRFSRALIATGASMAHPPIPGLDDIGVLDNAALFELDACPARLVVLGAGPIGVEMAKAFARFGSEVTVVDRAPHALPREDPAASAVVERALAEDGVRWALGHAIVEASRDGEVRKVVVQGPDGQRTLQADAVLLALGRRPHVEGLGLEAAGVRAGPAGVEVDAYLRTDNPAIYACGDVASAHGFTHTADAQARIVVQNALFLPTKRADGLVVPGVTYTDPEVGHVGPSYLDLAARSDLRAFEVDLAGLDRAITDGTTVGFAKAWVDGRGRLVAGTVVGPGAGDLVNALSVAITHGLGLGDFSSTIFAYPNHSEVLKRLGDAYQRTRLTPRVARWMRRWLRWRWGAALG